MKVQFLGAAKTVTGSCYMIEACGKRFCVDCGMHQGNKAIEQRNRDIKPYLPHIDSHPDARGGLAVPAAEHRLKVVFPEQWLEKGPDQLRDGRTEVLAQDPRPSYQHDPERIYGFGFARLEVKYTVDGDVLTVCGVTAEK